MSQLYSRRWLTSLTTFRGTILADLFLPMLVMGTITTIICVLDIVYGIVSIEITLGVHALLGAILSLLLVFRTNSAYERWWEGRKAWGALINNTRGFSVNLNSFLDKSDQTNRKFFSKALVIFTFIFVDHLKNNKKFEQKLLVDTEPLFKTVKEAQHKPNEVMKLMMDRLNDLVKNRELSEIYFLTLNEYIRAMIDCVGICERIKNTPIPNSYASFLRRFVFIYAITLPLGLVNDLGWLSIVVVMVVFYIVVGVELLGEEIEDPFGMDLNDLPIEELAHKIESNVYEILL